MNDLIGEGNLLPADLPNGMQLVEAGRRRARTITSPQTRYARERGMRSDRAYKEFCRESGLITTYINLGYKTWVETRDAIEYVQQKGKRLGFDLDRVSLIPDRRMGLPPELRTQALEETGIMMYDQQDWNGAVQDVDISVTWNDHNLGSPAALVNTEAMLRAGFDYIGSMAQHNYGYDLWDDDVEQMARTIEALGMIAEKRHEGVVVDAYVEDGFCAGFHDVASSLGWCMFHRYIVEDLIGAAHSQSYGSTFQDPLLKQAYGLAMQKINIHNVPASFTHGDTNSFSMDSDFDRNAAIVFSDVYYTAARELLSPSGGALHATPVSEAIRIPTEDELVQSLVIVSEAVARARASQALIDWRPVYELRDKILHGGRRFHHNLMVGLDGLGVDTKDPLQLILATRRIGGAKLEEMYGAGEPDSSFPRGTAPVVPTDTIRRLLSGVDSVMSSLREEGVPDLSGIRVVVASADIHEYGLFVVTRVLSSLGARVTDLGTSVSPSGVAKVAVETAADVVAVSTYNGMALSLGRQIQSELANRQIRPALFLGGRLNEDLAGESAVDVREELEASGIHACASLRDMVRRVRGAVSARS